jgi:hypothetical protein
MNNNADHDGYPDNGGNTLLRPQSISARPLAATTQNSQPQLGDGTSNLTTLFWFLGLGNK